MSRIVRLGVLGCALLSLLAFASGTAGAVTWHNSGTTSYTATGGATTLGVTGTNLICTGSQFTGMVGTSPFVGPTWIAATGTGQFTGCVVGGIPATTSCTYTVTATSWTAGPPAVMSGGADITCTSFIFGTLNCITQGTTPGTYTNPTGATAGHGVAPTSSSLRISGPNCMLGINDSASISTTPLTITSAVGPIIVRTA
jgi:hypothetical protein